MAKKKSPLTPPKGEVKKIEGIETTGGELPKAAPKMDDDVLVNYNIRYSKELQKRIKRFCIENDGIDMKDVFTQGAIMYMDRYKKRNNTNF
jgi:hypothetical protein